MWFFTCPGVADRFSWIAGAHQSGKVRMAAPFLYEGRRVLVSGGGSRGISCSIGRQ